MSLEREIEIDRFLAEASVPRHVQVALRFLLNEELKAAGKVVLVECGEDPAPALLAVEDDTVTFYFVEHEDEAANGWGVRTWRLAAPSGVRVVELRVLKPPSSEGTLTTTRIIAKHDAFPAGSVHHDCSKLDAAETESVRKLFQSWVRAE